MDVTRRTFNFVFGPIPKVEPREGRKVGCTPVSTYNLSILAIHILAATVDLDGKAKDVVDSALETSTGVFGYRLS